MKKLLIAFVLLTVCGFSCTTMLVTKGATEDGSIFVTHSEDDEVGDQRIIYVPAKDYPKGARRPIFPTNYERYPRYVGNYFSSAYATEGYPPTKPIGYIDQVPHTYAYFEGNYTIMNEHQLAMGECTNNSKYIFEKPSKDRIMYIDTIARIALERCKEARDAIRLMGRLAEKYGYYGWGETLLLADKKEGWVFEISCDPEGKSAVWVAKKVPDGEFFVAANIFRIREVDPHDPNMMYSSNLFALAKKYKWYDPSKGQKLDWLEAVSHGEYNHPYYCLRRIWRVLSRVNPSLNLSPWVKNGYTKEYPFSVKPQHKLSLHDVMELHRDYYQGTQFDLSKGMAAGPFGCPYRHIGPYDPAQNYIKGGMKVKGAWERPVSIFYCGYVYVNQVRPHLPDPIGGISWIGLNYPFTTCFVPFYCGVYGLPHSYEYINPNKFSRDTAWWAYNFVANWAGVKFSYMIKDIRKLQSKIETRERNQIADVDQKALALYHSNPVKARQYLTNYCIKNADQVLKQWWNLADYLVQKYTDGYINNPKIAQEVGYPKWWREKVGYFNGPTSYKKPSNKKK